MIGVWLGTCSMAPQKRKTENPGIDERIIKISKKIQELRKKAGYTNYEDFALDHDIGRMQYWRMEKGTSFTMMSLLKILDAHKITLREFFSSGID